MIYRRQAEETISSTTEEYDSLTAGEKVTTEDLSKETQKKLEEARSSQTIESEEVIDNDYVEPKDA